MKINHSPSPNHNSRKGQDVKCVIIHYTAGGSTKSTVSWLRMKESKVSAHFVIGRWGGVHQLVPLERSAWHAGRSESAWGKGVNYHSVGIELCNWGILHEIDGVFYTPGMKKYKGEAPIFLGDEWWEPYDERQLEALEQLLEHLKAEGLEEACSNLLGHNEVAPRRKIDPGPHFPWKRFR